MPLRLILTRHAKSSWDNPDQLDDARPLNPRGARSAQSLGTWLASRGYIPDTVLCSPAARTRETWDGMAQALPEGAKVHMQGKLYQADADTMLACLKQATGRTVLMLGHNPGIAEFAATLPASPPLGPNFAHYPTGATLVLAFEAPTWADVQPGTGSVLDFIVPRDLE